jgi:hypothetical protein
MNQEALLKILFFSIIALFAPNIFAANCGTRIGGLRNGHRYLLGDEHRSLSRSVSSYFDLRSAYRLNSTTQTSS